MENRRCILHIGICKTGTTSIQHGLAAHRCELAEMGIVVPRTLGPTHNHRHLTLLAVEEGTERAQREWEVLRRRDPRLNACTEYQEAQALVESDLASELSTYPKESLVVFSSEQLSQRLLNDDEVWKLKDALELLGLRDVRVVVYLREQVGLSLSWDCMEVLAGRGTKRLKDSSIHFDHRTLLERWGRVWGRDALLVRTYAKTHLEQADIFRDFVRHGLTLTHELGSSTHNTQLNVRLGWRSLWALRLANRVLPLVVQPEVFNDLRYRLRRVTEPTWIGGKPAQANRRLIQSLGEQYYASNKWVDENFGTQLRKTFGKT